MTATATPDAPTIDVEYATSVLAEHGVDVGGRKFIVATRQNYRQTGYINKWRRASKLDEMLKRFDPENDTEVSSFVADLIVESFENDAVFHLLAGGLLEVKHGRAQPWTLVHADALANWFAELDDPNDQARLNKAILGVVASFFLSRLVSSAVGRNSSSRDEGEPEREDSADTREPSAPTSRPSFDEPRSAPKESEIQAPTEQPKQQPRERPADLSDRILASIPESLPASEPASTSDHSTS